ncbi:MAG: RNA 2',3'-cyclic phosphodiesterase [Candidatus Kerfeldbacteria bacterium]|nr:RNA 2',3'-cyclic phosphodiesterase [Candidatus Kerfeldbacteria bacterium]
MFPRVFVGIPIRVPTAQRCLSALPALPVPTARLMPIQNWHITLAFLGSCPDPIVVQVIRVLRRVFRPIRSFDVTVHDIHIVAHRGILALRVEPHPSIIRLAHAVRAGLHTVPGLPYVSGHGHTDFQPHVTIARHVPLDRAHGFPLRSSVVLPIRTVQLIASTLHPTGPAYRSRATFRLAPR